MRNLVILLSLALLCSACSRTAQASRPTLTPPEIVQVKTCQLPDDPVTFVVTGTLGSTDANPTDCPSQYAVCFDGTNAAALKASIGALVLWIRDAMKACGS
jgi:hypothetical protein